jgi:hypothetical protein
MTRERITSERDAENTLHEYHRPKRHESNVKVHVEARAEHSMSGVNMNGFEFNPQDMLTAYSKLTECRDALVALRQRAEHLNSPLPDGTSLVAHHMRRAYQHRSDPDSGVQAVLDDYLAEVESVRVAIGTTLANYQGLDTEAATMIGQSEAGE